MWNTGRRPTAMGERSGGYRQAVDGSKGTATTGGGHEPTVMFSKKRAIQPLRAASRQRSTWSRRRRADWYGPTSDR
jgi:hypothetical protein